MQQLKHTNLSQQCKLSKRSAQDGITSLTRVFEEEFDVKKSTVNSIFEAAKITPLSEKFIARR